MIVLGYSGLDASVRYARRDPDLLPGEERIVQGLDSAAAILADGRIVAAAAEERFGTEKHTNAFPQEAIQYCLNEAGISMGDVDMVAHGFDYGRHATTIGAVSPALYAEVYSPIRQVELWRDRFDLPREKFVSVQHHIAHAASAYFTSPFADALCVVCDGMGEVDAMTIYAVRGGRPITAMSSPLSRSCCRVPRGPRCSPRRIATSPPLRRSAWNGSCSMSSRTGARRPGSGRSAWQAASR